MCVLACNFIWSEVIFRVEFSVGYHKNQDKKSKTKHLWIKIAPKMHIYGKHIRDIETSRKFIWNFKKVHVCYNGDDNYFYISQTSSGSHVDRHYQINEYQSLL